MQEQQDDRILACIKNAEDFIKAAKGSEIVSGWIMVVNLSDFILKNGEPPMTRGGLFTP